MEGETRVHIGSEIDIIEARERGRTIGKLVGFHPVDQTIIATAISEIARNIIFFAKQGTMSFEVIAEGNRRGILIVAKDSGPGIADISMAMQDGYSTSRGLGLGLPGVRRLMDEFQVISIVGKGTTVTMKKWVAHYD
ncbi:MAG: anti-sigma regulatory factor [Bacteroidetes bacterium]|nr:anti-sigma regulatory factor [Bacteroidota bacterium]